ncbi:MAG: HAD family phosphatase [Chloracidobacterium sp.]|nr:HAD family phosphatase [Chloracidobacterium sp.]MDW8218800.1 HAD family phosphatase [Acidobacteriota bacterium]
MSLKAVIFDYGKVLCLPQPAEVVDAIVKRLGVGYDAYAQAYMQFRGEYDRGTLDDIAYWQAVAGFCGRTVAPEVAQELADLDARGWSHPNRLLVDWAERVRGAGFKVGVLSNMQRSLRRRLNSLCPWLPAADAAVFSSDIGFIKPEPEIYRYALTQLRVRPEEALFIDDVETNAAAARELGLHALHFTDAPTLKRDLAAYPELPAF